MPTWHECVFMTLVLPALPCPGPAPAHPKACNVLSAAPPGRPLSASAWPSHRCDPTPFLPPSVLLRSNHFLDRANVRRLCPLLLAPYRL